jgi:hypothetical protein
MVFGRHTDVPPTSIWRASLDQGAEGFSGGYSAIGLMTDEVFCDEDICWFRVVTQVTLVDAEGQRVGATSIKTKPHQPVYLVVEPYNCIRGCSLYEGVTVRDFVFIP